MSLKLYWGLVFLIFIQLEAYCQTTVKNEYFITVNGNLYLPTGNINKDTYPILWYDETTDPKILIGGFGVGLAAFRSIHNKLNLKGQINLSKLTYWDEPVLLLDGNGSPAGIFLAGSSDYILGFVPTAHYLLTNKLSVGTGLGTQVLLTSLSRVPEFSNPKGVIAVNRYYKRFMPVLPVEVAYKTSKHLLNIRYELGLLNRLKKDLAVYKKDKFGLLFFEAGFKLN